jgi:hypothetical protein
MLNAFYNGYARDNLTLEELYDKNNAVYEDSINPDKAELYYRYFRYFNETRTVWNQPSTSDYAFVYDK